MKKLIVHKKEKILLCMLLTALLLTNIAAILVGVASATPKLYVDPPSIIDPTLKPGKTFSINITIANVTDLHSYDIKLGYGATILNVLSVGVFPIENLPSPIFGWDNQVGVVWINVTYGESVTTVTPVTLATIEFKVEDIGESILDLHDTKLADSQGGSILHGAFDGYFDNRTHPTASFTYSPVIPLVNQTVTFNASASQDVDGYIVNYTWNFGDGTPTVVETDSITTHVYIAAGTYNVILTVTDNDGLTGATTRSITIASPPVAIFTYSPVIPLVNQTVTFNATGSYDPDGGDVVSYGWDFGDGTTGTGIIVNHTYTLTAIYTVILTVTDDEGDTGSLLKYVNIGGPPIAIFTYSPLTPLVNQTVTFDASASYDPDGTIVSYEWDFRDENVTTVTEPTITHIYTAFGAYNVTLTVTDNATLTDTTWEIVKVGYPVAIFTYSPEVPLVNYTVTFDASASYDSDGTIVSYYWDFGDGTSPVNETDSITTHVYIAAGTYNVILTVTDNDGLTDTCIETVVVKTVEAVPPVAIFTYSPEVPLVNYTVTFDASASYDLDGTIVSYAWDFGDGTPSVTETDSITTHVYTVTDNYTVTLTVTDDTSLTDTYIETVRVSLFTLDYVEPKRSIVAVNDTFTINVNIANIINLYGYEFMLFYDTTILDGLDVTLPLGHFLTPTDPTKIFVAKLEIDDAYNATHGRVWVSATLLAPELPKNGSGTLATITFNVTDFGSCVLDLYDTKLSKKDGTPIEHETIDGYFSDPSPRAPRASFTYSPEAPIVSQTVIFNATESYDPDGYIVSYAWDFGDGTPPVVETDSITTHVYTDVGIYNVTLTVTDNASLTVAFLKTLKVRLPGRPVADFTYSPLYPLKNETVTFDASASYDLDGNITSYAWDFGDGTTGTGMIVNHTYTLAGAFTVTLTVTDNDGLTDTTLDIVKVGRWPVANFTYSPSTPLVNQTVTFDASASDDLDGVIVICFWEFGDGTNATGVIVEHAYSDDGNYTVTLTVTDDDWLKGTASASITVLNNPPVASFTESAETVYTGEVITFNASDSYDSDGSIVSHFWDFGDGTNATGVIVEHAYTENGTYIVALTVTDDDGAIASANATKTVLNRPPVAIFTESAETVYTGEPIAFNASDSYDLDGSIISYFWSFGDGTNATSMIIEHAYAEDGVYTVTLTVTDDDGALYSASAIKTVLNRPCVANFTWSPSVPSVDKTVTFDASASYDLDGNITSYAWDFGDGTTGTGMIVNHTYTSAGIYDVTLTVTDNDGLTDATTQSITVQEAPPPPSPPPPPYHLYAVAIIAIVVLAATAIYYMKIKKH